MDVRAAITVVTHAAVLAASRVVNEAELAHIIPIEVDVGVQCCNLCYKIP